MKYFVLSIALLCGLNSEAVRQSYNKFKIRIPANYAASATVNVVVTHDNHVVANAIGNTVCSWWRTGTIKELIAKCKSEPNQKNIDALGRNILQDECLLRELVRIGGDFDLSSQQYLGKAENTSGWVKGLCWAGGILGGICFVPASLASYEEHRSIVPGIGASLTLSSPFMLIAALLQIGVWNNEQNAKNFADLAEFIDIEIVK